EKIDPWMPHDGGWDYARARASGVNCVIDNIGTYGYWNYNYTPKQALRLIETFHQYAEKHADKMGVALSVPDARRIIASGRMAVFLGVESGFDHEGDLNVLASLYRLGLRTVQFSTQTGFNAFSDSALAPVQGGQKPEYYKGINERGRALVKEMNRLGVLIDITHGTEAVHLQLIDASRAPVVASHDTLAAVAGARGGARRLRGAGGRPDRGRVGRAGRLRGQVRRRRPRGDRPSHAGPAQRRAAERRRLRRDLRGDQARHHV